MPSAVRQQLPADLWRQGHRKPNSGSPGPFYANQEIQASPGQCDIYQVDKQQARHGSKRNSNKLHRKPAGRGSPKVLPRRGSADVLNDLLTDSDSSSSSDCKATAILSSSAKTESCLSKKPQESDAYAMESIVAPHPNEVPMPPLDWLQSLSKRSSSPAICGISLKAILGCQVAA